MSAALAIAIEVATHVALVKTVVDHQNGRHATSIKTSRRRGEGREGMASVFSDGLGDL